jgi:hypothetical protein
VYCDAGVEPQKGISVQAPVSSPRFQRLGDPARGGGRGGGTWWRWGVPCRQPLRSLTSAPAAVGVSAVRQVDLGCGSDGEWVTPLPIPVPGPRIAERRALPGPINNFPSGLEGGCISPPGRTVAGWAGPVAQRRAGPLISTPTGLEGGPCASETSILHHYFVS